MVVHREGGPLSGPKSISYSVESAAERRAREVRRLQGVRAGLLSRSRTIDRSIAAAADEWGDAIAAPDRTVESVAVNDADPAALERANQALVRELDRREAALGEQIRVARADRLAGVLVTGVSGSATSSADAIARRRAESATATSEDGAWHEEALEAVRRIVTRLDADASGEALERVAALTEAVQAADTRAEASLAVDTLRTVQQRANEHASAERARLARLDELRLELAGLGGSAVEAALAALDAACANGRLPDAALTGQVDAARAEALREADRRFAAATLEESLNTLGYEVGPDFDRLLVREGYADIRRTEWRGYAVRVRATGPDARLGFNVVRGPRGERQLARDAQVEHEWCRQIDRLREEMRAKGLSTEIERAAAPGEVAIQVVDDAPWDRDAATRDADDYVLERELDA